MILPEGRELRMSKNKIESWLSEAGSDLRIPQDTDWEHELPHPMHHHGRGGQAVLFPFN